MSGTPNKPLIIAHRGASALAPENTIAAFRKAIEDQAEGIEFDVRLTKDSVPIVFHDSSLKRICDKPWKVSELSYRNVKTLDAGSWFNEKYPEKQRSDFSKEKIPSLVEALEFLSGFTGIIYIELKCKESEIKTLSKKVCEMIRHSPLLPRIVIKSFTLNTIPYVQKHCSNVKTAALFAPKVMTILRKEERLIKIAHDLDADHVSLHFSLATSKLMKRAKKRGLPIAIWTADSPHWVKRCMRLGISSIITNNPARLLAKRYDILRRGSIGVQCS